MFFFLRCVFWLGIVYASMSWPTGTFETARLPQLGAGAIDLGRTETAKLGAQALAATAGAGIADLCARHMSECVEDAARLTSLIAAGDAPAASRADAAVATDVPLPVPDPRRAARGVKR